MIIIVDTAACIGCKNCELLCPHVFKVVDNKSNVINHDIKDCDMKEILAQCTPGAIKIYDDDF